MNGQNETQSKSPAPGLAVDEGSDFSREQLIIQRDAAEKLAHSHLCTAQKLAAMHAAKQLELEKLCDSYTALADKAAHEVRVLKEALEIAHRTMKQAQLELESGGARYTWLDAPIDIAVGLLSPNNSDVGPAGAGATQQEK